MYKFAQKLFVFLFVLTSAFVLTSVFNSKEVGAAGRTCCAVSPGGAPDYSNCDQCDTSGRYWKTSKDVNGIQCGTTIDPWGCQSTTTISSEGIAAGDYVCGADRPYGNACGDTSDGIFCTAAVTPNPLNLAVGETKRVSVSVKSYSAPLGFVRLLMGNTATAIFTGTTSPTNGDVAINRVKWNTCCGFSQSTRTFSVDVKGLAVGSTTIAAQGYSSDKDKWNSCPNTGTVNVGGTTALVCKPGAKCVSNTGVFKSGSYVTCSMPTLTSTELGGGTASYQLECTPYKATTAQTKIAKTSSNGTFGAFGIASGTTRYDCSFRYCLTKSGTTTCSVWGKL